MIKSKLNTFYQEAITNWWHWLFYVFCRVSLAFGFIAAGYVKIIGERFAAGLAVKHPMGSYLEALFHTSFYYTFIGVVQILAGILLVIPRTVILGALLYFPIIINIGVLSWALRFEGSLFTSTLMIFANVYVLIYNYERLKFILPLKTENLNYNKPSIQKRDKKFPFKFFSIVFLTAVGVLFASNSFEVKPRTNYNDCVSQFKDKLNQKPGFDFCDCIHNQGNSLSECLTIYEETIKNYQ